MSVFTSLTLDEVTKLLLAAHQRAQLARTELATKVEGSSTHQTAAKEGQPHDTTKDEESPQEPSNHPAKKLNPDRYRKRKEFSSRQNFHENCRRYYEEITHEPQVAPKEKVMVVKFDEDKVNAPSEPSAQPPNETTKEPEIASLKVQVARVKGETKEEEKDEAHCEPSPPPPSKDVPPKSRHIHPASKSRPNNGAPKRRPRPPHKKPPPWSSYGNKEGENIWRYIKGEICTSKGEDATSSTVSIDLVKGVPEIFALPYNYSSWYRELSYVTA